MAPFFKVLLALAGALALTKAQSDSNGVYIEGRMCPSEFKYAGEDSTDSNALKSYWMEEIARSPTYSCYYVNQADDGFNEALAKCDHKDGRVVILEDMQEVERIVAHIAPEDQKEFQFLTSAMKFEDINQWIWLGTNVSLLDQMKVNSTNSKTEQCLSVLVTRSNGTVSYDVMFKSVECNEQSNYMCEVRVQTVTYYAWFYSNWLTVILVLMTILLMMALCVSAFKYKSKRTVYRRSSPQVLADNASLPSHLPYSDAPPTYRDVTGVKAEGVMDKYKNKGKEILAKVTLYKNTSS